MRNFDRNSYKGGRCNAFNQHFKSENSNEKCNIISKELDINGNLCEILEKYFKFLDKSEKQYAKDFDSKHDDYRVIGQKIKPILLTKNLTCYHLIKGCLN